MQSHPGRTADSSRPERSNANITSAVGMEETAGHQRARRNSLFTHTVLWVTGLVCFAFLLGTLAQAWSNSHLMQQVQNEHQHWQQTQQYHDHLVQMAKHYQDPAVIESEARQQLGYIRPGEHPVVVVNANDQSQQNTQQYVHTPVRQGFWQEWWSAFFGN